MSAVARHWNQIKPAEHGAWSLLLTPFLIGIGLAIAMAHTADGAILALILFAVLALAVFLVRQPAAALVRVWRGRARRSGAGLALQWTFILTAVAAACGLGLLALGRDRLLILAIPAGIIFAVSLLIATLYGPRGLALELVGVLGLAFSAPGAYGAISGVLDAVSLAAWSISAAHSVVSILYVRLRVASRRDRVSNSARMLVAVAHLLAFVGVGIAGVLGGLPWLTALPFGLLLARALWAAWRNPPLGDVRRFGFTEMGLSLAFAALVVLAYLVLR
jgi:hypothetical protein